MNTQTNNENRRALPKFFVIILVSALFGGVLGFFSGLVGGTSLPEAAAEVLNIALREFSFYGIPACAVVLLGMSLALYRRAKARFAAWDGEDEAVMDELDQTLNWCLLWTSLDLILDFFLFGAACLLLRDESSSMRLLMVVVFFTLAIAAVTVLQQKIVDLTKKMNPEKRGSVYDIKFQKKWFESCDEAEQKQIGQAAMTAYLVTGRACLTLWVVLVVLSFVYRLSVLPIFLVMLLWGVLQISYITACIKMGGKSDGSVF